MPDDLTPSMKAAFISALRQWAGEYPDNAGKPVMMIYPHKLSALQMAAALEANTRDGETLSEIMARAIRSSGKDIETIVYEFLTPSFPPQQKRAP